MKDIHKHRWIRAFCGPFGARRGQATVELALVAPLLFLVLFGLFDLGRAVFTYTSFEHAVQEGARIGIYYDTTDLQIRDHIRQHGFGLANLPDENIVITPAHRNPRDVMTVTVSYPFKAATPFIDAVWGGGPIILSASTQVRVQ